MTQMNTHTVLMDYKINVKINITPKAIYRFLGIPIKISMALYHRNGIYNSEICIEAQNTQIPKIILRKKDKAETITLLDFKLYYKVTLFKTV